MKQTHIIRNEAEKRAIVERMARATVHRPWKVDVSFDDGRTNEQNRMLWALLRDISREVVWHGQKLKSEDWKAIFSAAQKGQRMVPGIEGGFVLLGASTSRMSKAELNEMIEMILAFGEEHSVMWTDTNGLSNGPNETE